MTIWKQAAISVAVLAAAGVLWGRHLPAAAALLERVGFPVGTAAAPEAPGEPMPGAVGAGPVVRGAEVVEARVDDSVTAIGDGRAARSVTLTPYVAGRVAGDRGRGRATSSAAGRRARAARLRHRGDRARPRAAGARGRARRRSARNEGWCSSRAVSEVQLLEAQLAVGQAELELRDAELALERRVIRAPFDGWVGILGVERRRPGRRPTTEVATLDDRSRILVDFRVPERFVGKVARRDAGRGAAAVAARSWRSRARWRRSTAGSTPTPGRCGCGRSLDNSDDRLRAGMAFSIALRFPGDTFAAVDPLAIQWSADGAYVWVGRRRQAEQVPVRIVQRNDDAVLVDADAAARDAWW